MLFLQTRVVVFTPVGPLLPKIGGVDIAKRTGLRAKQAHPVNSCAKVPTHCVYREGNPRHKKLLERSP